MAQKQVLTKDVKRLLIEAATPDTGFFVGQVKYNPQITNWKDDEGNTNPSMQVSFGEGVSFRIYENHPDWQMLKDYGKAGRMILFSFGGVSQNEGESKQGTQSGATVNEKKKYTNYHDVRVLHIARGDESLAEVDEDLEKNDDTVIKVVDKTSERRGKGKTVDAARSELETGFNAGGEAGKEAGAAGGTAEDTAGL